MFSTPQTEIVPIEMRDGVIRVGGTRVTLDTVVNAFNRSMSAEEIVIAYPALGLADTYDVIAFYLRHQEEVDHYIHQREERAEKVRHEVEARHPEMVGIRARLQARLDKQKRE
ncbi:MAG: DUF433 domain-containing protein [Chloroflexi bacterium]|nr:DUF433 domain-containing protein [Chloroflexota bacterium]MCC6892457.1 DUF433 domain-containing protein [Anaerolineae bacterium]